MATIDIVDLKLMAIIGTYAWERKNKQEIIIHLTLDYDSKKASHSDRLEDAIDYEKITKMVIKTVEKSRCQLIEKLANSIIENLKTFKSLQKITLRIDKPQAIPQARSVSYTVSS